MSGLDMGDASIIASLPPRTLHRIRSDARREAFKDIEARLAKEAGYFRSLARNSTNTRAMTDRFTALADAYTDAATLAREFTP